MITLIIIALLPGIVWALGKFNLTHLLMPFTTAGLLLALCTAICGWNKSAEPIYHNAIYFDNFSIAFSGLAIVTTVLVLVLIRTYIDKAECSTNQQYLSILLVLAGNVVLVSFYSVITLFAGLFIVLLGLYLQLARSSEKADNTIIKYGPASIAVVGVLLVGGGLLIYVTTGSWALTGIRDWSIAHPHDNSFSFHAGVILLMIALSLISVTPWQLFKTKNDRTQLSNITLFFVSLLIKVSSVIAFLRLFSISFALITEFWIPVLSVIIIVILIAGNWGAWYQSDFPRMLIFSGVTHTGYLLLGIAALGSGSGSAVFLYVTAYVMASLIAVGTGLLLQQSGGISLIESFNGLGRRNPFLAMVLSVALFSLAGIPLTAGFMGKFLMFSGALSRDQFGLVVTAVLSSAVGIYYYFKVIAAMYLRSAERADIAISAYNQWVLGFAALVIIAIGIYPTILLDFTYSI
ncbi:NADH-quinone oxidoreductase subunit N [Mucilaginibacter robiniae]|uniref:NADH-quinone oxidoreductase subunit N n=1 Tax=Mucilaginibacter robiniae TaxID=2728022 RepID=A0A7L5E171_9SPHI|nr:proton-conducting transporter membrane subunit [Mucilaginibacter robiniae]QJD95294.1 NADH-quinone oxidoreductase subunit N [Mucilaginibacter robiniae]